MPDLNEAVPNPEAEAAENEPDPQSSSNEITIEQLDAILTEHELKNITREGQPDLESEEEAVFAHTLRLLNQADVPYAVGAAFARNAYTAIWRGTKDLDIFLKAEDLKAVFQTLEAAGYRTEVTHDHWLAKAYSGNSMIDLIFASGHGQLVVDDSWIERARPANVLGVRSQIIGVEEMIALACFVAARSRFDGAEVAHLVHGMQGKLDWKRITDLLGEHRQLLLSQLILFDYIYPGHSSYLPQELMAKLFDEMRQRWQANTENPKAFRGMLLDPFSYTVDVEDWGYEDHRALTPRVNSQGELL